MPGSLAARDERRFRPELIFSRQHENIDVLHAARFDSHLNFPDAWGRRIGNVPLRNYFRPTESFTDHCFHERFPLKGEIL